MKRVYWSARRVSRPLILLVTVLALGTVAAVEFWPRPELDDLEERKLAAAQQAEQAMDALKAERLERGIPLEPDLDPAETGLIGTRETPTTSVAGHLGSKQTTVNPNWAAVLVELLHDAGVRPGDRVAVGWSGSFPALNLCTAVAIESLGAEPVAIASVGASQFGANFPQWTWLDMERHLHEQGLVTHRSHAASRGGYEDRALHMSDEGRKLVDAAIARNGLPQLLAVEFEDAIDERMVHYDRLAADQPVAAYVNVGGGAVSVGRSVGKRLYAPGLNLQPPPAATHIDSVMTRFAKRGAPVIHLVQVRDLAKSYGLKVEPTTRPVAGTGGAFEQPAPSRAVAVAGLVLVVTSLLLLTIRRERTEQPDSDAGDRANLQVLPESTSRAA